MAEQNRLERRYEALPEWLRWLLFLPVSLGLGIAGGWLLYFALARDALFPRLAEVLRPATIQSVFLIALHLTVPRAKNGLVLGVIVLRSLFVVFFLVATPLLYLGIIPGEDALASWVWWRDLVGECIVLVASVSLYRVMRESS